MAIVGITFSAADANVVLRGHPAPERPQLMPEQLRQALDEAGFAQCHVDEEALLSALDACNTQTQPFVYTVGTLRASQIVVTVAPDAMSATLDLLPPEGGTPASIDDVIQALALAGVVHGLDLQALQEACAAGQVAQRTVAEFGGIDYLVNNAAIFALLPEIQQELQWVNDSTGTVIDKESEAEGVAGVNGAKKPVLATSPAIS